MGNENGQLDVTILEGTFRKLKTINSSCMVYTSWPTSVVKHMRPTPRVVLLLFCREAWAPKLQLKTALTDSIIVFKVYHCTEVTWSRSTSGFSHCWARISLPQQQFRPVVRNCWSHQMQNGFDLPSLFNIISPPPPPIHMVKSLLPIPPNVILLGDRVFIEATKLSQGQQVGPPCNMSGVLVRGEIWTQSYAYKEDNVKKHREKVAICQQGRQVWNRSFLQPAEAASTADTLILDFQLPKL